MLKIKEYDLVLLKDGREASILEIYGDGDTIIADVGDGPHDWETIDISLDDIEKIIE